MQIRPSPAPAEPLTTLDGRLLHYGVLAGAEQLIGHSREINRINVFPVPDGDTGSNLASTFHSVVQRIQPQQSFASAAASMADAALEGARGNSGIIFAQFILGFSRAAEGFDRVDVPTFARLAAAAAAEAREAVAKPVEGTILTVMREWARALEHLKGTGDDFRHLLERAYHRALDALAETTGQLPVLARAGYVDAGAKGFVVFLEGIQELLRTGGLRAMLRSRREEVPLPGEGTGFHEVFTGRYCAEAIVTGEGLSADRLRGLLSDYGDSAVAAGSARKVRVHVHTDRPAELFQRLRNFGELPFQKAEDMLRQYETVHDRRGEIALVTDSGCDLPAELFDRHRVHMVPFSILVERDCWLDKLTLTPDSFYELLGKGEARPGTSQPPEKLFEDLYSFLTTHYESVVAVHINGRFSGTLGASTRAAERVAHRCGKRISVIDSRSISGCEALLVLRAAEALEAGATHDELVALLGDWVEKTRLFVSVPTLRYLVMSGRVSPMKGALGKLLNLKPVVSVGADGKPVLVGKAFSQAGCTRKALELVKRAAGEGEMWGYCILHAHDADAAGEFRERLERHLGRPPLFVSDVSPAIGLHAGPGALAAGLLLR